MKKKKKSKEAGKVELCSLVSLNIFVDAFWDKPQPGLCILPQYQKLFEIFRLAT